MSYIVQHIRSTEEGKRPQASQLAEGQFALNVNDSSPGVFLKTTEDKVVKVGGVSVGATAPLAVFNTEYSTGELWYNTSTGDLNVFDGSAWQTSGSQTLSTAEADLASRLAALELDPATSLQLTNGDTATLTAAKAYTDDFVTAINAQIAAASLSNIADGAQGVEVTGRVAAEGLDLSVGGQITAAGCSIDFQSATISFSGASISGLSGEIRDNVDLHLNQSTATDGQILSWDASANAGNGDYAWIAAPSGGAATASAFTWDASIIPDTNAAYDIGSAEYKVRHLFLSDNSIYFGDAEIPLTVDSGDLTFGGIPIMPRTLQNVLTTLGVDSYADQAAALLGGLIEGDVYYNTTESKLTSVTA